MKLKNIQYTAYSIAKLLDISPTIVRIWCRKGFIKASKTDPTHWWIKGKDFIDFLYLNPYYQRIYRSMDVSGKNAEAKELILLQLDSRPFLYSSYLVGQIFGVTSGAIKYWIKKGFITPLRRTRKGEYLFTQEAIDDFLYKTPRYQDAYNYYLIHKEEYK